MVKKPHRIKPILPWTMGIFLVFVKKRKKKKVLVGQSLNEACEHHSALFWHSRFYPTLCPNPSESFGERGTGTYSGQGCCCHRCHSCHIPLGSCTFPALRSAGLGAAFLAAFGTCCLSPLAYSAVFKRGKDKINTNLLPASAIRYTMFLKLRKAYGSKWLHSLQVPAYR